MRDWEQNWLRSEIRRLILQLISPNLLVSSDNLGGTTTNERRVASEKFLKGLKNAWADHQTIMAMLADVLMYMVCIHSILD